MLSGCWYGEELWLFWLAARHSSELRPVWLTRETDFHDYLNFLFCIRRYFPTPTHQAGKMSRTPNIKVRKAHDEDACQDLLSELVLAGNPLNKAVGSHEIKIISTCSGLAHALWSKSGFCWLAKGEGMGKALQLWIFRPEGKNLVPKLTERSIPDLTFSHPKDSSLGWSMKWLRFYWSETVGRDNRAQGAAGTAELATWGVLKSLWFNSRWSHIFWVIFKGKACCHAAATLPNPSLPQVPVTAAQLCLSQTVQAAPRQGAEPCSGRKSGNPDSL